VALVAGYRPFKVIACNSDGDVRMLRHVCPY
jgi:hypothetical protein